MILYLFQILTLHVVTKLVEFRRWTTPVQHRHISLTEYLENLVSQLLVGLVNVSLGQDVERGSHQSKECCIEVDSSISTQRHVHSDQALENISVSMRKHI